MTTSPNTKCRAKDPSKCRVHGSGDSADTSIWNVAQDLDLGTSKDITWMGEPRKGTSKWVAPGNPNDVIVVDYAELDNRDVRSRMLEILQEKAHAHREKAMNPEVEGPVRHLRSGDVMLSTGETVIEAYANSRTSKGKVTVVLEKNGKRRTTEWSANTKVRFNRKRSLALMNDLSGSMPPEDMARIVKQLDQNPITAPKTPIASKLSDNLDDLIASRPDATARLLDDIAKAGKSGPVILEGKPGVGKTSSLHSASGKTTIGEVLEIRVGHKSNNVIPFPGSKYEREQLSQPTYKVNKPSRKPSDKI